MHARTHTHTPCFSSSLSANANRDDAAIPLGFVVGGGSVRRGRTLKNEFNSTGEELAHRPAYRRYRHGEGGGGAHADTNSDDDSSLDTDQDIDDSVTLSAGHLHAV